jgi:hypothetical protein
VIVHVRQFFFGGGAGAALFHSESYVRIFRKDCLRYILGVFSQTHPVTLAADFYNSSHSFVCGALCPVFLIVNPMAAFCVKWPIILCHFRAENMAQMCRHFAPKIWHICVPPFFCRKYSTVVDILAENMTQLSSFAEIMAQI